MFLKKYQNLYRFKPYFTRYKHLLIPLFACMITASSMGVVMTYLSSQQMIAIADASIEPMIRFTLLVLGAVTIHHTTWFFWSKLYALIGSKIARDIRQDLAICTMDMKLKLLREHSLGYYLERMHDDTNEVSCFLQNVTGTLVDMFTNVSFLVIIYFQCWQCGLVFTLGIAGLYAIDRIRIRVEVQHTQKIKLLREALDGKMSEVTHGAKDIRMIGAKGKVLERVSENSNLLAQQEARKEHDVMLLTRIRTYCHWLIDTALVLMSALWLFPTGKITVVILMIILNYKGLMYETVGYISMLKGYYVQGDFKAGRILEILESDCENAQTGIKLAPGSKTVEVRNLTYAYEEQVVLNDVSFVLPAHSATVLTGASGSGKSTLLELMARLYDAPSGTILIDGQDIASVEEKNLRENIAVVSQEPFLFEGSIADNLRIVRPDASDYEIWDACRKAYIYDEIMAMPRKMDTILTENGGNLSGGQKQRLAIARAILRGAPIMLFDEPTSALDQGNQKLLLHTLGELKQEKTVFVIAHKLYDLSIFDQILTMENGRILGQEHINGATQY